MKIIKHRQHVTVTTYSLVFDYEGENGWGFSFDCDRRGRVKSLRPAGEKNYQACLTGTVDGRPVVARGIESRSHSYAEPAEGRCCCGRVVVLDSFTNECDCGRDYNMSGQLLAPRAQWGEETGECAADLRNL